MSSDKPILKHKGDHARLAEEMVEVRVAAATAKGLGSPAARSEAAAMLADLATDLHRVGDLGSLRRRDDNAHDTASVAESLPTFLARVRSMPEPSWFIKGLIPDEGVVVWHGRPRSMKSLTAEDALLSLALGEDCALRNPRFAIAAPVGVLWLGEEDSERLDAFRFGLMLEARGVEARRRSGSWCGQGGTSSPPQARRSCSRRSTTHRPRWMSRSGCWSSTRSGLRCPPSTAARRTPLGPVPSC